jgi:HEAT repeat protein
VAVWRTNKMTHDNLTLGTESSEVGNEPMEQKLARLREAYASCFWVEHKQGYDVLHFASEGPEYLAYSQARRDFMPYARDAVPLLVEELKDFTVLRGVCVEILASLDPEAAAPAIPAMINVAVAEGHPGALEAQAALRRFGPTALPTILEYLDRYEQEADFMSVQALLFGVVLPIATTEILVEEVMPRARRYLEHADEDLRETGANVIAHIGIARVGLPERARAMDCLRRLVHDRNRFIREAAGEALRRSGEAVSER